MLDQTAKNWLALWLTPGLGPKGILDLYEHFGSPDRVLGMSVKELTTAGLSPSMAEKVANAASNPELEQELRNIENHKLKLIHFESEDYPKLLREIQYPPPVLYQRGELDLNEGLFLAFVGSRKASYAGKSQCKRLIHELAKHHEKIVVVSGLALGIDAAAHEAALECGLKTVAVLAGGLSQIYPKQNIALSKAILERGGSWITEFPVYTQPKAAHFPLRNRIISGLSRGVMIVEAGERSGATITAGYALEQSRELFAFPGPPDSAFSIGTNRLIQRGSAKLVLDAKDILDEILAEVIHETTRDKAPVLKSVELPKDLSEEERLLMELLLQGGCHQDELAAKCGMPFPNLLASLTTLEMKGLIYQKAGSVFEVA